MNKSDIQTKVMMMRLKGENMCLDDDLTIYLFRQIYVEAIISIWTDRMTKNYRFRTMDEFLEWVKSE